MARKVGVGALLSSPPAVSLPTRPSAWVASAWARPLRRVPAPPPPARGGRPPRHLPRCPAGSPACHGGRGCRAGQGSNEQENFIMHDEFLYIAKARPGPPLVTGSVRHASRAAGGAVKHLLHSHLSAGTGSL